MGKIPAPIVTATLAAGSTTSPYRFLVNISQKLCFGTCTGDTPVFTPDVTLLGVSLAGTGTYVATVHIEGIISYVPCNGGCCDMKAQPISTNVNIPIASTTDPTVTITKGNVTNAIVATGCQTCSRNFVSEIVLAVAVA